MSDTGWQEGRWWLIELADGSIWCETSVESEARAALKRAPGEGAQLYRLMTRTQERWEKRS